VVIGASFLAVIVLVSLVVLSLNGGFSRQPLVEEVVAEPVGWEIERPSELIGIDQVTENIYENEEASLNLTVHIYKYDEEDRGYGGCDTLGMGVSVAANVEAGCVEHINVTFYDDIQPSKMYWFELEQKGQFDNLSLVDYSHCRASEESVEASVYMNGVNQPRQIHFKASLTWKLKTTNNESHQITVSSEIAYYNGTAYKEVVLPIVLQVVADADDSFETARPIGFGSYTAFIEFIDDPEDWYKIWFEEGQSVSAMLILQEPRGLYVDLYLYSPDGTLVVNSSSREPNGVEQITYAISQSGSWYIRVLNPSAAETLYTLSIKEE
jgi:hypothetical protein